MLFKQGTPLYSFEVVREANNQVMYINYLGALEVPSIAENPDIMARTIDLLTQALNITRVVFVQQRNYSYDSVQVFYLQEIANLHLFLTKKEKILSPLKLSIANSPYVSQRYNDVTFLMNELVQDPIACYIDLNRIIRKERVNLENTEAALKLDQATYLRLLEKFNSLLEETKLIGSCKDSLADYSPGDREIYFRFFRPDIIPNFTFTRLAASLPSDAEIMEQYNIGEGDDESVVTIMKNINDAKYFYHLMPPEYSLVEDKQELLNLARNVLIEHQPKAEEFTDPEKTRQVFLNVAMDLLRDLSESKKIKVDYSELTKLARILVRHTIGFGLIEVLLQDRKIQDIVLNSPISANPIFLRHQDFDECVTNIIPSKEDADSWAAKLRMISGRPLDEANPILDSDLGLGNIRARVAAIQQPLSPDGLAYAIRRHREDPWTLPLFIKNKMLNSFSAGLMSFLIDGSRTLLVAGTRSSGKCVDGNTLIQLDDGDIIKIKEMIGEKKKEIEDGIIYNPVCENCVKSLGGMKIENKKVTDVWKRISPERVVRIRLKSGKEIITTKEHPYFVYKNKLENKRADELKISDLIASPRELNISGEDIRINLRNHPNLIKEEDDFFILKGRTNSSTVKFPKRLTPELAEFIGLVVGDGHLDKTKLGFFNNNNELREKYISLVKMFDVNYNVFRSRTTCVVQVSSRVLNRVLSEIFEIPFGKKSDKVVIPSLILRSDNNILSKFLRGYFDCDGYIPENKRDIEIVSASKSMSEYLRLALLRFGITAFTKRKIVNGVDYYRILIRGDFVNNYAKYIGFFHPMKKERLDSIILKNHISNTNTDTIPNGNNILRELRKRLRVSPKSLRESGKDYWAYETNQYRVTRNWFGKLIHFYKKRFKSLALFKEDINNLEKFINFDYSNYLDKFERVRKLLHFSYVSLATESKFSDSGLRKILQKKTIGSLHALEEVFSLVNILSKRINELSLVNNIEVKVENIPILVDKGIISYVQLSRETNIPETSLKYYCNGKTQVLDNLRVLIESKLIEIKSKILLNIDEAAGLLFELNGFYDITRNVQMGIFLSRLREELNISNEEFVSKGVSFQTVSNFFNGVYTPSFDVLKSITNSIIKIFNLTISNEVEELILEADKLAKSDIFWDEVINIEEIDKVDDYVYDLTVEDNHSFVANGLIAHNTSLLGSLMLEIMQKYRIIVLEDSVTGDAKIIIKENGKFRKTTIGEFIDEQIKKNGFLDVDCREKSLNPDKIQVFSINKKGKVVLAEPSKFIRHRINKQIYEIATTSGKKIKVTEDHSLFTIDEKSIFKSIKSKEIKEGSFIAIPSKLIFNNKIESINLLENLEKLNKKIFILGRSVEKYIKNNRKELFKLAYSLGYKKSAIQNWTIKKIIPVRIFNYVKDEINKNDLKIKSYGASKVIDANLYFDEDFIKFIGLWLADGCYDKDSVIISVVEEENRDIVRKVAKRFGIPVKMHSDSFSLMLNSSLLKEIMQKILLLNGNSYTKKIPDWAYNLPDESIGWILAGYFSGDGCVSDKEIIFASCSKELVDDIATLLLRFNIVLRISEQRARDKTYPCRIGSTKMINSFIKNIGFIVHSKQEKLEKLCSRISTHDTSDIIPLSIEVKEELNDILGDKFNKHDYITRENNIGRNQLSKFLELVPSGITNPIDPLREIVKSDIFWDKVKSVRKVKSEGYVYDISVPLCENFICENIIAHNTLELPVEAIRKLNYDILRMKVRSSLLKTSTEVGADEGIRTSLRLGDSSLIVGEVRSNEAQALYEAMRVGALANVVAGTIHGASPYAVFDRVVNDLKVPVTSFKATDIVIVANPIKTSDGMRSMKRVVQLAEVRKHWTDDPEEEGGFVDLLKYNVEKDTLEPSEELINGDSQIIKDIAANVRGWAGDWDAVYDNILLRGKIKQELVDISAKLKIPEILEAKFNSLSNTMFHEFSKQVQEEIGLPSSERVFPMWQEWLKESVKGRKIS